MADRGCDPAAFNFADCFFLDAEHANRAGFFYQADYTPRSWAETSVGYQFEDENGIFDTQFLTTDNFGNPIIGDDLTRGVRLNHDLFIQQRITRGRYSVVGGVRFVHNPSFGNRAVPASRPPSWLREETPGSLEHACAFLMPKVSKSPRSKKPSELPERSSLTPIRI